MPYHNATWRNIKTPCNMAVKEFVQKGEKKDKGRRGNENDISITVKQGFIF